MVTGSLTGGKYGAVLPTAISNCLWWLDAADSNSVILNGADVAQWNDKSGNQYNVAQTVAAKQPLYDTGALNSLNAITFTVAGEEGLFTTSAPFVGNFPHSIFIIANPVAVVDFDVLGTGAIASGNILVMFYHSRVRGHDFRNGVTIMADSAAAVTGDTTYLIGQILNTASTEFSVNLNGTLTTLGVAGVAGAPSTTLTIPGRDVTTYSDVTIGEIIIYDKEVNESERNIIQTYLKDKWAYV